MNYVRIRVICEHLYLQFFNSLKKLNKSGVRQPTVTLQINNIFLYLGNQHSIEIKNKNKKSILFHAYMLSFYSFLISI